MIIEPFLRWKKLEDRIDESYEDKLDGSITPSDYDKDRKKSVISE